MRRLYAGLSASLLVHFTLALSAWFFFGRSAAEPRRPVPPLSVEYLSLPPVSAAVSAARATSPGRPGAPRVRNHVSARVARLPLSAFAPLWPTQIPQTSTDDESPEELTWADSRAYDGVSLTKRNSGAAEDFLGSLWRMIDQYLEENPFLSEYNHTGRVFLRFEVEEAGRLETRTFQASAADRVLKVLAARAVRKALKNATGDLRFPGERVVVNARFSWSDYAACRSLRGQQGNFLSFCHYAENKRKSFSAGEKAGTYAGAIWDNGPWAYEEIQKYNREQRRRQSLFNPFEELERDPDWNL